MEEKISRKEFLAAAAAVGAATLIPTATAGADPVEDGGESTGFAQLEEHMEVEEGVESLEGSVWETLAATPQVDVLKSYSGYHMMNQPGYFAFTGWDPAYNQPTDVGFGFSQSNAGGTFSIIGRFEINGGAPFEFSTNDQFTGKYWIDNKPIYRKVINWGAQGDYVDETRAHGIADIKDIVDIYGICKESEQLPNYFRIPYAVNSGGQFYATTVYATAQNIVLKSSFGFIDAKIVIEYTHARY